MRALLDTNIVIHRENIKVTNRSIGQLYYWLDKLHYEKLIHPYTLDELKKYQNEQVQDLYDAKLSAYIKMTTIAPQPYEFAAVLHDTPKTDNDKIDNQLLCEVYLGRADILITEDRRMLIKAQSLGIADKVYTINSFISKCISENPEFIDYKALMVRQTKFGNVDVSDSFFDTFRAAYEGFDRWFAKKCDETAYICRNDKDEILGFLYLKVEGIDENYSDINPPFAPKKRLKVGTFKVESTGFRLGERFVKIIFDNAQAQQVDEIYITLFVDRSELLALKSLLERWGFFEYGSKGAGDYKEVVLVKRMNFYDDTQSTRKNFPNIRYNRKKFYLPIEAKYHTPLLPDSILKTENEIDFLGNTPEKYALQKVYISFSYKRNMKSGDFVLLYRKGIHEGRKGYESAITTIAIIDEVKYGFLTKEEFLSYCENRSIFSRDELEDFWARYKNCILVVKFIFVKKLGRPILLNELWDRGYIRMYGGPRSFDELTDEQFNTILESSSTTIKTV